MKNSQRLYHLRHGFSLVEIVIAIAVIGIMAAAALPLIQTTMDKSKRSRANSEMEAVVTAVTALFADTGRVPGQIACSGSTPKSLSNVDGDAHAGDVGFASIVPSTRVLMTVSGLDDTTVGSAMLANGSLFSSNGKIMSAAVWEDLDRHVGVGNGTGADCTKTVRNYDDPEKSLYWKGPYLSPQDRIDPWGKSFVLLAPATTDFGSADQVFSFSEERPGWVVVAGDVGGFIESGFDGDSVDYNPDDVGKKVLLR